MEKTVGGIQKFRASFYYPWHYPHAISQCYRLLDSKLHRPALRHGDVLQGDHGRHLAAAQDARRARRAHLGDPHRHRHPLRHGALEHVDARPDQDLPQRPAAGAALVRQPPHRTAGGRRARPAGPHAGAAVQDPHEPARRPHQPRGRHRHGSLVRLAARGRRPLPARALHRGVRPLLGQDRLALLQGAERGHPQGQRAGGRGDPEHPGGARGVGGGGGGEAVRHLHPQVPRRHLAHPPHRDGSSLLEPHARLLHQRVAALRRLLAHHPEETHPGPVHGLQLLPRPLLRRLQLHRGLVLRDALHGPQHRPLLRASGPHQRHQQQARRRHSGPMPGLPHLPRGGVPVPEPARRAGAAERVLRAAAG
mmetsp:Transcript_56840/g.149731  ORF Transcript_56840/g.149731 Transcript_56840/m.149731 type:complete len:364 (-) Transcript_56840:804-1895(-)